MSGMAVHLTQAIGAARLVMARCRATQQGNELPQHSTAQHSTAQHSTAQHRIEQNSSTPGHLSVWEFTAQHGHHLACMTASCLSSTTCCICRIHNKQSLIASQVLILVAAAFITTVTNKILYYFALYTNSFERYASSPALCCSPG